VEGRAVKLIQDVTTRRWNTLHNLWLVTQTKDVLVSAGKWGWLDM